MPSTSTSAFARLPSPSLAPSAATTLARLRVRIGPMSQPRSPRMPPRMCRQNGTRLWKPCLFLRVRFMMPSLRTPTQNAPPPVAMKSLDVLPRVEGVRTMSLTISKIREGGRSGPPPAPAGASGREKSPSESSPRRSIAFVRKRLKKSSFLLLLTRRSPRCETMRSHSSVNGPWAISRSIGIGDANAPSSDSQISSSSLPRASRHASL
mmetsp:Transcript_5687/g.11279  ORF Transcript_5687/g.11279 Transcript_5687/m.11279 type:complete len:208 (+) Transcript_5687:324-947(+)